MLTYRKSMLSYFGRILADYVEVLWSEDCTLHSVFPLSATNATVFSFFETYKNYDNFDLVGLTDVILMKHRVGCSILHLSNSSDRRNVKPMFHFCRQVNKGCQLDDLQYSMYFQPTPLKTRQAQCSAASSLSGAMSHSALSSCREHMSNDWEVAIRSNVLAFIGSMRTLYADSSQWKMKSPTPQIDRILCICAFICFVTLKWKKDVCSFFPR